MTETFQITVQEKKKKQKKTKSNLRDTHENIGKPSQLIQQN